MAFGVLFACILGGGGAVSQPALVFADHYQQTIRGITVRVPKRYAEFIFGNDGFRIRVFSDDLRPSGARDPPDTPSDRRRDLITVSVGGQRRFTGRDIVERGIHIRATDSDHVPAAVASELDGPGGPPVPEGLVYYRALPAPPTASGVRDDMFVPREPMRASGGVPLPEAIFCLSASAPVRMLRPPGYRGELACHWMLTWRDLEVSVFLSRSHLADWHGLRGRILALLESFVVDGPTEAGPPPDSLPNYRPR